MTKQPQDSEEIQQDTDAQQQVAELTADLQRTRADFENYRKRVEAEKATARANGQSSAVLKLLPVIDTIDRAVGHTPEELAGNKWVDGVAKLPKSLEKALGGLDVVRIKAAPGVEFDPSLHEAIQFDEEAAGDKEVIAEELQAGYTLGGAPIRPAMVKVTRK
ncbi:nucleotide exchange factor GrpE [Candidatus Saccharibacteria bacterium]|nr:nucleotide exchange factor GrpE [Candidatus Saccharibacteria bacterium]